MKESEVDKGVVGVIPVAAHAAEEGLLLNESKEEKKGEGKLEMKGACRGFEVFEARRGEAETADEELSA